MGELGMRIVRGDRMGSGVGNTLSQNTLYCQAPNILWKYKTMKSKLFLDFYFLLQYFKYFLKKNLVIGSEHNLSFSLHHPPYLASPPIFQRGFWVTDSNSQDALETQYSQLSAEFWRFKVILLSQVDKMSPISYMQSFS